MRVIFGRKIGRKCGKLILGLFSNMDAFGQADPVPTMNDDSSAKETWFAVLR